ncbi:MAG: PIN domain-containing protein [Deinococcota bacterium]|nr:PIN domain-containing protein [Deinococcota bacterium]
MVIIADSGAVYGFFNHKDEHHAQLRVLFERERNILIPTAVLAEIAYLLETRVGTKALEIFLKAIENRLLLLAGSEADIRRIRELVVKYGDLPLGFADAAVIALAEREGGRVATTDRRHFTIVKAKRPLKLLPEP